MAFNDLVTRGDAAALIPEPVAREIQQAVTNVSVARTLMRTIPMSSATMRMPVVDSLPQSYWVAGDTGLKQTTRVSWAEKSMQVEELATIVVIPEAVIADMDYDPWAQIRPMIEESIARALDGAILFGFDKPNTWPEAIVPAAIAAGNTVTGDPPDSISAALSLLEEQDVSVSGIAARGSVRGALRLALAALGGASAFSGAPNDLWGYQLLYPTPTSQWPSGITAVVGDYNAAVLGVRQDITYKMITEGVITDPQGNVTVNLPQQDSVAMRVVARFAYQVAEVLTGDGNDVVPVYPFAVAQTGNGASGAEAAAARGRRAA